MVNCQLRNDFKGRARKMGVFEGGGGGGGGGVDMALDLRIFGDGVYNFFFVPPLGKPSVFFFFFFKYSA